MQDNPQKPNRPPQDDPDVVVAVELCKACDAAIENVRRKYPQPPGYCIGISAANTIEVFCTGDNNEE